MKHGVTVCGLALAASLFAVAAEAATLLGEAQRMGNGTVRSYMELGADGKPMALGVAMSAEAFDGLPALRNTTSRCFDLNKNGRIDDRTECEGDMELRLDLPAEASADPAIPFAWMGVNWNPEGHPPEAWGVPHFDFHFYMASRDEIDGIRVGGCNIFIDCDDLKTATLPVPAKYVAEDHISVGAAVSMMGDHLIDKRTPELGNPPKPFTHTWIFGAFDRRITFYEPMITMAFLKSRPDICTPIRQPNAWQKAGYYPTKYCIRYRAAQGDYGVSLEGLTYRKAD